MADFLIDVNGFGAGLQLLEDTTDAPVGSARRMGNVMITDRGGISPRPGTKVLGPWDTGANGCDGFFNLIKSGSATELPMKVSGGTLAYLHPTLLTWNTIKTGYTVGAEFGFTEFIQSSNFIDYAMFCNAVEAFARWQGLLDTVATALVGSETSISINGSTLTNVVFDSGNAINTRFTQSNTAGTSSNWGGSSWSTITDTNIALTTNQYLNYLFMLTSGPLAGHTYLITGNTATVFTLQNSPDAATNPLSNFSYVIFGNGQNAVQNNQQIIDTNKSWTPHQWQTSGGISYYVHFTSGLNKGLIALISDNTNFWMSFPNLPNPPADNDAYEIRQLAYPATGTLVVNGIFISYSAITSDTTFTIGAPGSAIAAGSAITLGVDTYAGVPRGNRLATYQASNAGVLLMGAAAPNLQVTITGTPQATSSATLYRSKRGDATDFSYTGAGRTAGQGDAIIFPYGGGNIIDVVAQEAAFYTFKKHYIESDTYSTADVFQGQPLKQEFGAVNRVIKGTDDVYFMTPDNQFTSLGRVALKDTLPQTTNIGYVIKRLLNSYDFSKVAGIEYRQRLYIACKDKVGGSFNNKVLVYNKGSKAFEGVWNLNVFLFEFINDGLYFAESATPNVMQMFAGLNDVRNSVNIPIQVSWRSNQIHIVPRRSRFRVKPSQFMIEGINTIGYEGYIRDGSQVTLSLFADFADDTSPSLQFTFGILPTDEAFMQPNVSVGRFLGDNPLGIDPVFSSVTDPDLNGDRHFKFVTYFPDIYCNYLSLGIDSNQLDCFYEITRIGLGTAEDPMQAAGNILTP